MIRNIVFDLGNVLVRYDPAEMLAGTSLDAAGRALFVREIFGGPEWQACDRGDGTKEEILSPVLARLPLQLAETARDMLFNDDFERLYLPPVSGMETVTVPLLERGLRLYVLSNAGFTMRGRTDAMPILRPFAGIYISAEHHLLKPDPAIFTDFCATFGLRPSECLFIDDSPRNTESARGVGMRTICFSSLSEPPETLYKKISACLADGITE